MKNEFGIDVDYWSRVFRENAEEQAAYMWPEECEARRDYVERKTREGVLARCYPAPRRCPCCGSVGVR